LGRQQQRRLGEHEDDRAQKQQTVPQEIDLTTEIGVRNESGIGVAAARGDREKSGSGECIGCNPPKAGGIIHARNSLISSG
jgi:hypothetical protein